MNSSTHLTTPPLFRFQCHFRPSCSFRRRPRFRRRLGDNKSPTIFDNKKLGLSNPFPDSKLEAVIDLQSLTNHAELKLRDFLSSANDAFADIQTLVTVDSNHRILVSCRRSTIEFAANLVLYSFVLGFALWVLGRIGSAIKGTFRRSPVMVTRRDRSLGGKEVVVSIEEVQRRPGGVDNPLSLAQESAGGIPAKASWRNLVQVGERLPKWWPLSVQSPVVGVDTEDYQKEANRLIRAVTDNRTHGKDIMEDDIIQLRRICRISGIRVSFDTTNTRDSFYRTSVDFVLNDCSSAPSDSSFVEIDGEDARQFIAGLADNIGLEDFRAARIVSAAVAARTRSRFLQAWALEMQGQHSGMVAELSKICLILRIFPPDESSPEMEMVARGLEKNLKVEQRQYLMDVLAGISDEKTHQIAAEALGLKYFPNRLGVQ